MASSAWWCFQGRREELERGLWKRFHLVMELLPGDLNVRVVSIRVFHCSKTSRSDERLDGKKQTLQIFRCSSHLPASNGESEESRKRPAAKQHVKKSVYPTWVVGLGSRLIWDFMSVTAVSQLQSSRVCAPFVNHLGASTIGVKHGSSWASSHLRIPFRVAHSLLKLWTSRPVFCFLIQTFLFCIMCSCMFHSLMCFSF